MEEPVLELLVSPALLVVEASVVVEVEVEVVDPDSVADDDPFVGVAEPEVDSDPLDDPVGDADPVVDPVPVAVSDPVAVPDWLVSVKYGRVTEPVSTVPVAEAEPVSVGVAPPKSVDCSCLCWMLAAWAMEEPKRATRTVDDLICIVED